MAEIPYICLHEIIVQVYHSLGYSVFVGNLRLPVVLDKRIILFLATAEQGVHYAGYPPVSYTHLTLPTNSRV